MTGKRDAQRHGQRHPLALDGCGRKGQFRSPRPADGLRRYRDRALHQGDEVRSRRSLVARSRPLRALGRPRLDAALLGALSPRLRGHDDRPDQAVPAAQLEDRRPPRISLRRRHRDHHRPARPGPRQLGRHGDRGSKARGRVRRRSRRPPHLGARRRRLPDGRHLARKRSRSPGTSSSTSSCVIWDNNNITIDGAVSNADSTDQIARFKACGWNTIEIDGHDQDAGREGADRRAEVRQADADRGQDHHRLRRAQEGRARTASTARRSARKSWQAPRRSSGSPIPPSRSRPRSSTPGARRARARRMRAAPGKAGSLAPKPELRGRVRAPHRRQAARRPSSDAIDAAKKKLGRRQAEGRDAARRARMALEVINAVVPETIGGSADLTGSNLTNTTETLPFTADRPHRPLHALRHPRARAWRRR